MTEKREKKVEHSLRSSWTELTPIISRHECIDSYYLGHLCPSIFEAKDF